MVIDFIFCLLQVVLSDLINKKQIFFKQFSLRAWIFIRLYICMFTDAQFRLTNFRVAYCLLLVTFYVKVIILSCSFSCVSSFTHSSLQYLLRLFRYGLSIRLNACCTHGLQICARTDGSIFSYPLFLRVPLHFTLKIGTEAQHEEKIYMTGGVIQHNNTHRNPLH